MQLPQGVQVKRCPWHDGQVQLSITVCGTERAVASLPVKDARNVADALLLVASDVDTVFVKVKKHRWELKPGEEIIR